MTIVDGCWGDLVVAAKVVGEIEVCKVFHWAIDAQGKLGRARKVLAQWKESSKDEACELDGGKKGRG